MATTPPTRTMSLHEFRKRTATATERAAANTPFEAHRVDMLQRLYARLDRQCGTDTLVGKRCRHRADPLSPVCAQHKRRPSLAMLLAPPTSRPSKPEPAGELPPRGEPPTPEQRQAEHERWLPLHRRLAKGPG